MSNVQTPATYFTAPLLDQIVQEIDVDISLSLIFTTMTERLSI